MGLLAIANHLISMARYSNRLRPIQRIKHVIDAEGGLTAGAQSDTPLIKSVDAPLIGNITDVVTGSNVSAIYLHVEVSHTSGVGRPNMYLSVMKNPGNNLVIPAANAVGSNDNKRYVIHQEMIMLSGDAGNGLPRPIFNGVIKIPKGYQRMGPDDRLYVSLLSPTVVGDFCLQCHYKEFR